MKEVTIEYEAQSRGFFQKIVIQNKLALITNNRTKKTKSIALSKTDCKNITAAYNELNLENLNTLKAPTEKRFYDGAAIAHLTITENGKKYETPAFDHGFPPQEIEKLVTLMVTLNTNNTN
ncbi:hypothetical protein [Flavobacterium agrisoli]|uniref:Uncharacterized protein n=1 Tax=Flavobacterium agrisoli TaxID=2793066 RepID=A0A934PMT9_9FLAO|nr:hypothetical protein [Flavobacterium agrisoli]MBK0369740.1 hypothetical protein [Flavobacterium agrisoli]